MLSRASHAQRLIAPLIVAMAPAMGPALAGPAGEWAGRRPPPPPPPPPFLPPGLGLEGPSAPPEADPWGQGPDDAFGLMAVPKRKVRRQRLNFNLWRGCAPMGIP